MTDVLMPALSPTMEEGTLAKWHVKVGDSVRSGDVIAEIETDKATMEVEAVDEGVVEALLVPEGTEEVKVNTPIARLKGDGAESPPSPPRGGVGGGGLSPPPEPAPEKAPESARARSEPVPASPPSPTPSPQGGRGQQAAGDPEKQPPESAKPKPDGEGPPPSRPLRRNPTPRSPPAPSWSASPSAMRCAMRWPRRCGAIRTCS